MHAHIRTGQNAATYIRIARVRVRKTQEAITAGRLPRFRVGALRRGAFATLQCHLSCKEFLVKFCWIFFMFLCQTCTTPRNYYWRTQTNWREICQNEKQRKRHNKRKSNATRNTVRSSVTPNPVMSHRQISFLYLVMITKKVFAFCCVVLIIFFA